AVAGNHRPATLRGLRKESSIAIRKAAQAITVIRGPSTRQAADPLPGRGSLALSQPTSQSPASTRQMEVVTRRAKKNRRSEASHAAQTLHKSTPGSPVP